ncbi:hypothetical protein [Merismopedia glauca]|uniref:CARDB domain-containing protein n=1 Tax=Merismopedia glauca CCAP 1448/3 TaxID=1296344 RepID=A0A2T1C5R7_9CYAN|nr:hypothetical protein [Merismopedia glauca]PSB03473.1 hypothetical protein C7B64_08270 [Merismopedia glauca CCAP 1448/3]
MPQITRPDPNLPDIVPVFKRFKGSSSGAGFGSNPDDRGVSLQISFKNCQATTSSVFVSVNDGPETQVVNNLLGLCDVADGSGFLYGFGIPKSATKVKIRVIADSKKEVAERNEFNNQLIIEKTIPAFPGAFDFTN